MEFSFVQIDTIYYTCYCHNNESLEFFGSTLLFVCTTVFLEFADANQRVTQTCGSSTCNTLFLKLATLFRRMRMRQTVMWSDKLPCLKNWTKHVNHRGTILTKQLNNDHVDVYIYIYIYIYIYNMVIIRNHVEHEIQYALISHKIFYSQIN